MSALAEGRLAMFRGFDDCTADDAAAAFGATREGGGSSHPWGRARRHVGGPATPVGVEVIVDGEHIVAIAVVRPALAQPLRASLGEPETKIESGLSSDWQQWAYATRGLTAHVAGGSEAVMVVYAYEPMNTPDFLRSPIAKITTTEHLLDQ